MYWFNAVPPGVLRGELNGNTSNVVFGEVVLPYNAVARLMICDLSEVNCWLVARPAEAMLGGAARMGKGIVGKAGEGRAQSAGVGVGVGCAWCCCCSRLARLGVSVM